MPLIIDEKSIEVLRKRQRAKKLRPVKPSAKAERDLRLRMNQLWERVLFPATDKIRKMVEDGASPSALADVIEQVLRQAEFEYNIAAEDIVWRWKASVEKETRWALQKGLKHSLGVDVTAIVDAPVVRDALAVGGMAAAGLIKSIPGAFLGEVARAVAANFTGQPLPEGRSLQEQIQHLGGVSKNRAKLIARDQTSKMTGLLNKTRQESIGIDLYIWRTSKDQRVVGNPGGTYPEGGKIHGNHYAMEGKLCKWGDPTVYSGDGGKTWRKRHGDMPHAHPGEEIQCRCYAEPHVDIKRILAHSQSL